MIVRSVGAIAQDYSIPERPITSPELSEKIALMENSEKE